MEDPRDSGRYGQRIRLETYVLPRERDMIASRMHAAGLTNISQFARELLTAGIVRVSNRRAFAQELSRHIGPIGNNVNQIAKLANTNSIATYQMVEQTLQLLSEVQAVVTSLKGEDNGSGQIDPDTHDTQGSPRVRDGQGED